MPLLMMNTYRQNYRYAVKFSNILLDILTARLIKHFLYD